MDMNEVENSRRKFIRTACLATSGTVILSTGLSLAVKADSLNVFSVINSDISDLNKIVTLLQNKNTKLKWLFTGDSITHGAKHTHGQRSFPEIFSERVRWEMGRMNDVVINTGISGNVASQIIEDFEWRVAQFNPSVIFLMIGTNDCSKKKNISTQAFELALNTFINKCKAINVIPVLLTPNLIELEKSDERAALPEYVATIKAVCKKNNLIVVDNWLYWKETNDNSEQKNTVYKSWLNDPIHPNGIGHQEIARSIFKALNIFDMQAPTCGAEYYEGKH